MNPRWILAAAAALLLAPVPRADAQDGDKKNPPKADLKTYRVPFKLTDTNHVMVRCKVNGKGPFNFIVDTGAPLVYLSIPTAKKMGLEFDEKKPGVTLKRFEVEGGPAHEDFKVLIDTPFQLRGMNAMGFPGYELHGIIGYTLLSHYKVEYDFTADRLAWTRLDFKPPAPEPIGAKEDKAKTGLDNLGPFMEAMAILMGKTKRTPPEPRGFFGFQVEDKGGAAVVKGVLADGPAARAGIKAGDRITQVGTKEVQTAAEVLRQVAEVTAGATVSFIVQRGDARQEITVTAGEGL
jgi:hypothetical protein